MRKEDSSAVVSVTAYPEACDGSWEKSASASALPPSPAVGLPSSAPPPSSKVAVPSPAQPATGRMVEENNGVVCVTVYTEECHDRGNKSSSVPAPSSAVAVPSPAPAPGRMLEDYHGAVYVTAYPEVCHDRGPESSSVLAPSFAVEVLSSAPAPSSVVEVLAPGWMVEENKGAVSVTAYPEVFHDSRHKSSLAPAPSSVVAVPAPALAQMLWENNGAVSVTTYPEVFHDSRNKSSLAPAPSSVVAVPAPALAQMLWENGAVSITAYPEMFHDSVNKSSSAPAPSSAVAVPAPALAQMLWENNSVVSVTAYPEVFHDTGNKSSLAPASSSAVAILSQAPAPCRMLEENNGVVSVTAYPQAGHGTGKKSSSPSFVAALAPASDQMLKGNNGVVSVSAYLQAGHGTGKKKPPSPSSAAAVAPALGWTLEDYAKEWAARKEASGAPLHHCVLPFLSGMPKAVECRVCYKIVHPSEEIKCSVSRCEQTFHLSCVVEDTANFITESFKCPQHGCMVCKQKMFFWRCGRCTVAAHTKCAPWPLIHLKDDQGSAICWRHPSNWLLQNENADLTNNIEEAFCRLPLPYVNEEFNIDSTIRDFSAIVCKPPSYTHIRRNVYLVKKKRADSSAETGCRNCRADSVCRDDCECRGLSMSCSKNCRCSDLCSNKPFRKDKKFKIVKSEGCGWGAVSLEPLEKGDFIIEYVGEVINDVTCEQRLWEMKRRGDKNFYMCEISKDCTIDATFKGNTSRFLNHSCDPNCKLEKWQVDGETRVGVFASRSIEVGEPLTYDYRFVHFGEKVKCNCGAKSCQGYLGVQLKNPTQDALAAAALENQGDCSPSRLKPETHLLPWTSCIEVPFYLRSKTKIDRLCWGRKRQRTSIIDPSTSSVTEAAASVP